MEQVLSCLLGSGVDTPSKQNAKGHGRDAFVILHVFCLRTGVACAAVSGPPLGYDMHVLHTAVPRKRSGRPMIDPQFRQRR